MKMIKNNSAVKADTTSDLWEKMNKLTVGECFFQIRNGANIKQGVADGGFPITRIETIANDRFNRDRMGYAGITDADKYQSYILEDGDLLMSHINSVQYLGRTVLYHKQENEKIIHGMNLLAMKANRDILNPAYAQYYFRSIPFRAQIRQIAKKSVNQASFTVSDLKKIPIQVPSLLEQCNAVETLDRVNKLLELYQHQLQTLDKLVKARFVELFGDPKINPNNYLVCPLSEYISFLTSGSRGWAQYCTDNGSEWFITIKNVKDCHISTDNMQPIDAPDNAEAKRTKVQEGDLLISITADLGRTGVVTKEIAEHGAYINQHLTCIRLNKTVLNPLYVAYFMESPAGKEQFELKNQSAVKAGLNFNSIKSLRIMIPSINEQNMFVEFLNQTDKSKVAVQKSLDEAQLLFDSLMQQYFE